MTSYHTRSTFASMDRMASRKMEPAGETSDFVQQAIRKLNNLELRNRGLDSDCDDCDDCDSVFEIY